MSIAAVCLFHGADASKNDVHTERQRLWSSLITLCSCSFRLVFDNMSSVHRFRSVNDDDRRIRRYSHKSRKQTL